LNLGLAGVLRFGWGGIYVWLEQVFKGVVLAVCFFVLSCWVRWLGLGVFFAFGFWGELQLDMRKSISEIT